jgi:hypothetical protein
MSSRATDKFKPNQAPANISKSVAGTGDRIRANEQEILRVIRKHLRRLAHP